VSKRAYSLELKYEIIMDYKSEDYALSELCSKYQIYKSTLCKWIDKFEELGIHGLKHRNHGKSILRNKKIQEKEGQAL